jgi:tetratricopeptide (TPR) repeat protein
LAAGVWSLHARALAATTDPSTGGQIPSATDLNNQGVTAAQAGQFEAGVDYLRQALKANPQDDVVRKNLSGVLTDWASRLERTGHVDRAEQLLLEAIEHEPGNGKAFVLLGDLSYFKRSDFAQAVAYWKRAHGTLPTAEWRVLADRISQAQRDQAIERGFLSEQTAHFDMRLQRQDGLTLSTLGELLEEEYAQLMAVLGGGPSKVTVIVYMEQDLRRTYNQRDWAMGFYDGRLRLLWNEVGTDSARTLVAHELAHAFLHHGYGNSLPIWVHEGFAQLQEGPRPLTEAERRLEQGIASGASWVPLKWLDRRFTHPSSREDVWRAYVQARLVVAELVKRHGMGRFTRFLQKLSEGTAVDAAYDTAFAPSRWSRTDQTILR